MRNRRAADLDGRRRLAVCLRGGGLPILRELVFGGSTVGRRSDPTRSTHTSTHSPVGL